MGFDAIYNNGIKYELHSLIAKGTVCEVYKGISSRGENVCIKVPIDRADNVLLTNEAEILKRIEHKSMPILIDNFYDDNAKAINVLNNIEGIDLVSLKEKFPDGVPIQHVSWILDRLLSVVGYLHYANIIHGFIEPSNIIINPKNHNAILIDYSFAIADANTEDEKYKYFVEHYSAPEILQKAKPHPRTDIYSLGKVALFLLGGNIETGEFPSTMDDKEISSYMFKMFISQLIQTDVNKRATDVWEEWHKLREIRDEFFDKFVELNI